MKLDSKLGNLPEALKEQIIFCGFYNGKEGKLDKNPISIVTKEEKFIMGWPTHIVAEGGYVFDKCGNMLIVKTHNRGWDCTGGQIEIGENFLRIQVLDVIY